ncbi:ABC transporter permease [Tardisphaera miroshnichenkoae]
MNARSIARLVYRNYRANLDPGTFSVLLFMPAMFLIFLGLGYGSLSGSSYLSFLAPGIMASECVTAGLFSGGMLWSDRRWGMLAQLLVGPFTRMEYLVANAVMSTTVGLLGSTAMLALYWAIGGRMPSSALDYLMMYTSLAAGSLFFSSIFLIVAALIKSAVTFNSLQNVLVFALDFGSTIFYPAGASLPAALRVVVQLNPESYVVDLTRAGFSGAFSLLEMYEMATLWAIALAGLVIASWVYSTMRIYTQ